MPVTTCRAICGQLEEAGLIERDAEKRYHARVEPEALVSGIEDLAARLDTKQRQDSRRLQAMAEYAGSEECRSVFIRKWFGEEDPPRCGHCDRCRRLSELDRAVIGKKKKNAAAGAPAGCSLPTRKREWATRENGLPGERTALPSDGRGIHALELAATLRRETDCQRRHDDRGRGREHGRSVDTGPPAGEREGIEPAFVMLRMRFVLDAASMHVRTHTRDPRSSAGSRAR